jgi:hypothetical protein
MRRLLILLSLPLLVGCPKQDCDTLRTAAVAACLQPGPLCDAATVAAQGCATPTTPPPTTPTTTLPAPPPTTLPEQPTTPVTTLPPVTPPTTLPPSPPVEQPAEAACTLGTPHWSQASHPHFRIYVDGGGFGATALADFGADYYCRIGWTAACNEGRRTGPVAPDGHPQRVACERAFMGVRCPRFLHSKCSGTGDQCPLTFDPYVFDHALGREVPFPPNVAADCPMDPQDSSDVRAYKVWVSGKGKFKVCMGAREGYETPCTEGPELER